MRPSPVLAHLHGCKSVQAWQVHVHHQLWQPPYCICHQLPSWPERLLLFPAIQYKNIQCQPISDTHTTSCLMRNNNIAESKWKTTQNTEIHITLMFNNPLYKYHVTGSVNNTKKRDCANKEHCQSGHFTNSSLKIYWRDQYFQDCPPCLPNARVKEKERMIS